MWNLIGKFVFYIAWPLWFVYFRLHPVRSRVLVVHGQDVLLVRGWLSDGRWGLPGGGAKRHEDVKQSAVRELLEETGIHIESSALREIGSHLHRDKGLRYQASYYVLELTEKPLTKKQWPEIADIKWFDMSEVRGRILNQDAAFILKKYLPVTQTSLLSD